jgi:hypothetical protein
LILIVKVPKMLELAVDLDLGNPFLGALVPALIVVERAINRRGHDVRVGLVRQWTIMAQH